MKPDTIQWVVHTVVKKIVDKYDPSIEWEDLVAEGYLIAVESAPSHDPKQCKMSTYLYACIHNHLVDMIRKVNREQQFDKEYGYEEPVARDNKLTLDLMERKLEGRQLEVFQMLREGHSQREVASTLGISQTLVARELKRIRERLV